MIESFCPKNSCTFLKSKRTLLTTTVLVLVTNRMQTPELIKKVKSSFSQHNRCPKCDGKHVTKRYTFSRRRPTENRQWCMNKNYLPIFTWYDQESLACYWTYDLLCCYESRWWKILSIRIDRFLSNDIFNHSLQQTYSAMFWKIVSIGRKCFTMAMNEAHHLISFKSQTALQTTANIINRLFYPWAIVSRGYTCPFLAESNLICYIALLAQRIL